MRPSVVPRRQRPEASNAPQVVQVIWYEAIRKGSKPQWCWPGPIGRGGGWVSTCNCLGLLLLPKHIVVVRGIALACERGHALLDLRTTAAVYVDALLHSKRGTRPDAFGTDCVTSVAVSTGSSLVHHSLHKIAHHTYHNLHGTAGDPVHWHSRPLENGVHCHAVQCSSDVLVADIVLGFSTGRGEAR